MNTRQLALIDDEAATAREWRLDDHTRQVGLNGIAAARQALREARAHLHDHHDQGHSHGGQQSTAA